MNELEFALEDCLQQLAANKSSLDQCLKSYPGLASELRPLLETALRLQQGRDVLPSAAFRERTRAELAEHIASHPRRPSKRRRPIPGFALPVLILALAFVVSTAFAQSALPGQSLYSWKLSAERAWRVTSVDPLSFDLSLADRRTDELITVCNHNGPETDGIAAYTEVLDRLSRETPGADSDKVLSQLQAHQKKLLQAGIHVPELDDIVLRSKSLHGKGSNADQP